MAFSQKLTWSTSQFSGEIDRSGASCNALKMDFLNWFDIVEDWNEEATVEGGAGTDFLLLLLKE
jgi:hypothetical protein